MKIAIGTKSTIMLTARYERKILTTNLFQNEEFELDVLEAYKKSRWVETTTKKQQQQNNNNNNNNSDKPRSKDETTQF